MKITRTTNCTDRNCELKAKLLSHFNELKKINKDGSIDYDRSSKYRCDSGHLTIVKSVINSGKMKLDNDPKEPSKKRFHMPGFKGHKVNKPNYRFFGKPRRPADITNKQAMYLRAEQRKRYTQ